MLAWGALYFAGLILIAVGFTGGMETRKLYWGLYVMAGLKPLIIAPPPPWPKRGAKKGTRKTGF